MAEYSTVGKSIPRVDGLEKATGKAVFTGDMHLPGMLTGKIKRCAYPFAKILSINTEKARKLTGVKAVITAKNVTQFSYGYVVDDELPLANTYARYAGEEVAAVAAIDEDTAEEAIDLIEVEYEKLPYVLDAEEAMKPGTPVVHLNRENAKQNIAHHVEFIRGQGEAAFKQADLILEQRFSTQVAHQAYLETQACIAQWDISGKLTVWGATQNPFYIRNVLAGALGIPEHQVRIIVPSIGGAFGGKGYLHPHFPISALLAKVSGKPVKIEYTREEEFISGRPRISEIIDLRLGFKKDGTIIAKSAALIANCGAYAGVCPYIMAASASRADSLYRLFNIKVTANLVYTNTTPRGPFRGFGNPQMFFAMESLIDQAASELGIDPIELRLKNAIHKGETTVHGWILKSCGFDKTLRLAREKSNWSKSRQKSDKYHGFGVACQVHNGGNKAIAAAQGGYDGSSAIINVDQYGKVKVISGEGELGQGILTVFTQIASEALGVPPNDITVMPQVDTDVSPFSFGAVADRGTVLGGNAVLMAAKDARKQLLEYAAAKLGLPIDDLDIKHGKFYDKDSSKEVATVREIAHDTVLNKLGGAYITGRGEYRVPDFVVVPDKSGYGNFCICYTFSTTVAEVSVDSDTGQVNVLNIWHAVNIGRAINPAACEGQVEGGIIQGIGYALSEDYIWNQGILENPNFTDYKVPLSAGVPKIHCLWIEEPNPDSPFGAKCIAEHSLSPVAPAIANAIYNAIGVRLKDLPLSPEKVLKALAEKKRGNKG